MGAGIVECDVAFTKDGELVCRHDECDLHTTINIVSTVLNAKCTVPWSEPHSNAKCCTSDLSFSEVQVAQRTITRIPSISLRSDASANIDPILGSSIDLRGTLGIRLLCYFRDMASHSNNQ